MKDLVYTYKGNRYMIIDANCVMKHPETGEWLDAVIYKDKSGRVYIREIEDFKSKFILL